MNQTLFALACTWVLPAVLAARERDDLAVLRERLHAEDLTLVELALPAGLPEEFALVVPGDPSGRFAAQPITLDLRRRSVRSENFRVVVELGPGRFESLDPGPVRTYFGEIRGRPGSAVRGLLSSAGLELWVREDGGAEWLLAPTSRATAEPTAPGGTALQGLLDADSVRDWNYPGDQPERGWECGWYGEEASHEDFTRCTELDIYRGSQSFIGGGGEVRDHPEGYPRLGRYSQHPHGDRRQLGVRRYTSEVRAWARLHYDIARRVATDSS